MNMTKREPKSVKLDGKKKYVVVSYSHKDVDIVYKELCALEDQKASFWYDRDNKTGEDWLENITNQIEKGGIFVASIRDYDALLIDKPPYSPPYIHKTENGKRVSFQTWDWEGDKYKLVQYIIDDENTLQISKFECKYWAIRRDLLTNLLLSNGCSKVSWLFPKDTGFYQPIVIAKK